MRRVEGVKKSPEAILARANPSARRLPRDENLLARRRASDGPHSLALLPQGSPGMTYRGCWECANSCEPDSNSWTRDSNSCNWQNPRRSADSNSLTLESGMFL